MTGLRATAVADSDSYLKWAAATLDRLNCAQRDLLVVRSHLIPSPEQAAAALSGTSWAGQSPPVLTLPALTRRLREQRPQVLLVAATGPFAQLVLRAAARLPYRPVVVCGLPGMSVPATELALRYRQGTDIFLVHSRRELADFTALGERLGISPRFAVNRLAFLDRGAAEPDTTDLRRVVFTPQAHFPADRGGREQVLRALGRLAEHRPDLDVVVKLRARAHEAQTHREEEPYDLLAADLADAPGVGRLRTATGPLSGFLDPGTVLVTVSSTAVLEAVARGLRALVLSDFGIGEHNLTAVYADSGLVGSLDDLSAARFHHADPAWSEDNYLHAEADQLPQELAAATAPDAVLPAVETGPPVGGRERLLRALARSSAPRPLLRVVGRADRWLRRRLRRLLGRTPGSGSVRPVAPAPTGTGGGPPVR